MNGLIKAAIAAMVLVLSSITASAASAGCISQQDLSEIASSFSQFDRFLSSQSEYCEKDLGDQWYGIAKSLVILKNLQPDEPTSNADDAFTYKAISEKDWWAYFTNRANKFTIQSQCQQYVVAYVSPFFGRGNINLCPLFFEQPVTSQASVMMHEVRHFDGHRHVTCSQGNEKGNSGACDDEITNKGSYAISVQTLVGMARSEGVDSQEKPVVEAEAVYMAFNKFNRVPKVRLENSLILSSDQGEVASYNLNGQIETIGQLPEPSVVLNSANNLTIYPTDASSEAYRKDNKLFVQMENPGLYAKHYNSETPSEREKYKSISYFAPGGLLKGNELLTLCNSNTTDLGKTDLSSMGDFVTIMSMSLDEKDQERESLLLARSGEIYRFDCVGSNSDKVKFEKTSMTFNGDASEIVDSFGFKGEQYALLTDGTLAVIQFTGQTLQLNRLNIAGTQGFWLSATPISIPEVF